MITQIQTWLSETSDPSRRAALEGCLKLALELEEALKTWEEGCEGHAARFESTYTRGKVQGIHGSVDMLRHFLAKDFPCPK